MSTFVEKLADLTATPTFLKRFGRWINFLLSAVLLLLLGIVFVNAYYYLYFNDKDQETNEISNTLFTATYPRVIYRNGSPYSIYIYPSSQLTETTTLSVIGTSGIYIVPGTQTTHTFNPKEYSTQVITLSHDFKASSQGYIYLATQVGLSGSVSITKESSDGATLRRLFFFDSAANLIAIFVATTALGLLLAWLQKVTVEQEEVLNKQRDEDALKAAQAKAEIESKANQARAEAERRAAQVVFNDQLDELPAVLRRETAGGQQAAEMISYIIGAKSVDYLDELQRKLCDYIGDLLQGGSNRLTDAEIEVQLKQLDPRSRHALISVLIARAPQRLSTRSLNILRSFCDGSLPSSEDVHDLIGRENQRRSSDIFIRGQAVVSNIQRDPEFPDINPTNLLTYSSVFIYGGPGSGKTTLLRLLQRLPHMPVTEYERSVNLYIDSRNMGSHTTITHTLCTHLIRQLLHSLSYDRDRKIWNDIHPEYQQIIRGLAHQTTPVESDVKSAHIKTIAGVHTDIYSVGKILEQLRCSVIVLCIDNFPFHVSTDDLINQIRAILPQQVFARITYAHVPSAELSISAEEDFALSDGFSYHLFLDKYWRQPPYARLDGRLGAVLNELERKLPIFSKNASEHLVTVAHSPYELELWRRIFIDAYNKEFVTVEQWNIIYNLIMEKKKAGGSRGTRLHIRDWERVRQEFFATQPAASTG